MNDGPRNRPPQVGDEVFSLRCILAPSKADGTCSGVAQVAGAFARALDG
ncbi:hypothetical protein [Streptomyces atratus]|nr:hypothetical protein [Streptomyces atratus]MCT2543591.1 hypothetical protein [Streptomyces atratus]